MKDFLSSKEVITSLILIIIFLIIIVMGLFIISIFNEHNDNKDDLQPIKDTYEGVFKINNTLVENTVLTAVIEENKIKENNDDKEVNEENKILIPNIYNGFETIGKIKIPKTGLDTFILKQVTVDGMKIAPCFLYTTGELNKSGNTLIVGHNYQNNTLFSNNKYLDIDDSIFITNLEGDEKEYIIYDKFITDADDISYLKKDIQEGIGIALSCCTDYGNNNDSRIVILAKNK